MYQIDRTNKNWAKRLLNGHLDSPQSKFHISNYYLPLRNWDFCFCINTFMCALKRGYTCLFFQTKNFGNKLELIYCSSVIDMRLHYSQIKNMYYLIHFNFGKGSMCTVSMRCSAELRSSVKEGVFIAPSLTYI
jgi:hypothetical protein